MKLLGREINPADVIETIEARLRARGLLAGDEEPVAYDGPEPRVEPLTFNLQALERNADPTQPLPLHTHRRGIGRAVLAAKWVFRKTFKVFIIEALSRQRLFNGHVRDSYAQLSAEVMKLRREVEELKGAAKPKPPPSPRKRSTRDR